MKKFLMILGVLAIVGMFAMADDDSPRGPVIVAQLSLTGQTSPISSTVLYTPAVDGNYVVSGYAMVNPTVSGPNGALQVGIGWTDEFNTYPTPDFGVNGGFSFPNGKSSNDGSVGNPPGSGALGVFVHVKGGAPIKYNTLWFLGTTGHPIPAGSYDLFITVVKE